MHVSGKRGADADICGQDTEESIGCGVEEFNVPLKFSIMPIKYKKSKKRCKVPIPAPLSNISSSDDEPVNVNMRKPKVGAEFITLHYFPILSAYLNGCWKIIPIVLVHDFTTPGVILDVSALSCYDQHFPRHFAPFRIDS